jgi:hypothetical protein
MPVDKLRVFQLREQGWTLQRIGDLLGCTGERVRQIAKDTEAKLPPPPQKWPIPRFTTKMRSWLRSAGYFRCHGQCKLWLKLEHFHKSAARLAQHACRDCDTAKHSKYAAAQRASNAKWRKTHPNEYAAIQARWRARKAQGRPPLSREERCARAQEAADRRYNR